MTRRSPVSRRSALLATTAAAALGLAACGGDAEADFPSDTITFIVQAPAGGASDLSSRTLSSQLEDILDVNIVVENRPGASGSIAFEYVANQDPDGYTIGFMPVEMAILQHVGYPDMTADRFTFLGQVMNSPVVFGVPADSPYDTFEEFLDAAQSQEFSVANSGTASSFAAATTALARETGAQLRPVPFDGGADVVAATIGGQVDAMAGGAGESAQAYADGQLKLLAVFAEEPHPALDGVPTARELGYDLTFGAWGGVYGPADLPEEVIEVLEPAIREAAQSDTFVNTISPTGSIPTYRTGAEFAAFIDEETVRYGELLDQ